MARARWGTRARASAWPRGPGRARLHSRTRRARAPISLLLGQTPDRGMVELLPMPEPFTAGLLEDVGEVVEFLLGHRDRGPILAVPGPDRRRAALELLPQALGHDLHIGAGRLGRVSEQQPSQRQPPRDRGPRDDEITRSIDGLDSNCHVWQSTGTRMDCGQCPLIKNGATGSMGQRGDRWTSARRSGARDPSVLLIPTLDRSRGHEQPTLRGALGLARSRPKPTPATEHDRRSMAR